MTLPPDIHPDSGSRLPLVRRDDLDARGREEFDALTARGGASLAGLRGPGGLNLHDPRAAVFLNGLSRYLRFESGLDARLREVAILITAREHDQAFEWAMHEATALKEGVPSATIEAIRHCAATDGLDERDAVVIEFGRQLFARHAVDAALYVKAKALFGERVLVALVMLMGNYAFVSTMLTAFDAQLPAGQTSALLPKK
jgi:4-carboxymuconolactone decarboxylase